MEEIEALRKALGFDKWNVLGHSYGGVAVQQYALDYPSSVNKLILTSNFYSGEMWQENDNSSNIARKDADFLISGDIGPLDFRDKLKDMHMPMLILQGRFDRISIPRFALKYKSYAPQAEFVMFERSGHDSFNEEPGKTFKVIGEFWGEAGCILGK